MSRKDKPMSTTERGLWRSMLTTLMALMTTARVTAVGTTIEPMHTIWFEESLNVASAAFAPDGSVVYVHLHPEVIDTGDVAVQYWPEILGVISLSLTLMVSLLIWRVIRRPRQQRCCGSPGSHGWFFAVLPPLARFRRQRSVLRRYSVAADLRALRAAQLCPREARLMPGMCVSDGTIRYV